MSDDGYPYDEEVNDDDEPTCTVCGASLYCDEHEWDCPYADEDDEDE